MNDKWALAVRERIAAEAATDFDWTNYEGPFDFFPTPDKKCFDKIKNASSCGFHFADYFSRAPV